MALDADLQDPAGNAPKQRARGLLFPLGVASLLLGMLFLLFWYLWGMAPDLPDVDATEVQTRRWILIAVGSFLSLQGLALLVVRFAGSESLGAGAARNKLVLNVVVMVALASLLLLLVNYIFARHELWRLDVTTQKMHSLSQESAALVRTLPSEVKVIVLTPGGEGASQLERLIDQYQAATTQLRIERYNPRTMEQAEFRAILDELDLSANMTEGELLGIVVQSGTETDGEWVKGRSKHIGWQTLWRRDMSDPSTPRMAFHGEQLISSAIREVISAEQPRIYFLSGHGELSIEDFDERKGISRMVKLLRQRNLDVDELNLLDREKIDVPEDCRLLVVPAPVKPLTPLEVESVKTYLDGGGRAMFFMEPLIRKGPDGHAVFEETGLEALLVKSFGIEPRDELLFLKFFDPRRRGAEGRPDITVKDLAIDHKITTSLSVVKGRVLLYGSRPISTRPMVDVETSDLLSTTSWGTACFSSVDPTSPQVPEVMRDGPFALGVAGEYTPGEKADRQPSRVVVYGDVHWINNQFLRDRAYSNQELLLNSVNWLMYREDLNVGETFSPPNNRLIMTQGTLARLKALACPGMPAIALALGVFAWMIRRRT